MRNNGEFGKNVLKFGLAATLLTTEFTGACSMPKKRFDEKGNPIAAVSPETVKPTPPPDGKADTGWSFSGLYNKAASAIGGGDKPKPTPTPEVVDVSKIETEHLELKKTDAVQFTPAERGQVSNTQERPTGPVLDAKAYQMSGGNTDTGGKISYRKGQSSSFDNNGMPWSMGGNSAAAAASRERVVAVPGATVESAVKDGEIRTVETVTVIDGRVNTQPIHWTRQGNFFVTDQIAANPSFIVTVAGGWTAKIVGAKWVIPTQVLQP